MEWWFKMTRFRLNEVNPIESRRISKIREPKKLLIIFTEGVKTEQIYFEAFANSKFLDEKLTLKLMNRLKVDIGHSHPMKIIKSIESYIQTSRSLKRKSKNELSQLLDKFKNQEMKLIELIRFTNLLKENEIFKHLSLEELLLDQIEAFVTLVNFDDEFDRIMLVFDRDMKSLSETQYNEIVNIAANNNFLLGISNPSFELFLFLHLSDLDGEDCQKIKENDKNGDKTYIELLLKRISKSKGCQFNKNRYDPNFFIDQFENGIINSFKLSCDSSQLKDNIGTSIFKVLESLVNDVTLDVK